MVVVMMIVMRLGSRWPAGREALGLGKRIRLDSHSFGHAGILRPSRLREGFLRILHGSPALSAELVSLAVPITAELAGDGFDIGRKIQTRVLDSIFRVNLGS